MQDHSARIKELEQTIQELKDRNIRHEIAVILAEVMIFCIGVGVGVFFTIT